MKKIVYTFLFTTLVTGSVFAQEEEASTSAPMKNEKSGGCCGDKNFTPEAGDIGLGFDARPLFGFFTSGTSTSASPNTTNSVIPSIFLRYFLAEDMAVRVNVNMVQQNTIAEAQIWSGNEADAFERVTDTRSNSNGAFALGVGVEKRRGYKRVQGYMGADIQYERRSDRTFYTYGNAMTDADQTPISHNWGQLTNTNALNDANGDPWTGAARRQVANYGATTAAWSLNGIIGAEYYIAPKVSIGGEFKLGYAYSKTKNDGEIQWQMRDGAGTIVENVKQNVGPTSKSYGIRPISGGSIILSMYF